MGDVAVTCGHLPSTDSAPGLGTVGAFEDLVGVGRFKTVTAMSPLEGLAAAQWLSSGSTLRSANSTYDPEICWVHDTASAVGEFGGHHFGHGGTLDQQPIGTDLGFATRIVQLELMVFQKIIELPQPCYSRWASCER